MMMSGTGRSSANRADGPGGSRPSPRPVRRALRAFGRRRDGGVAAIFALALVPLLVCGGAALDYSRASNARTYLFAASDAAALSTVTPAAMALKPSEARAAALDLFNARAAQLGYAEHVKPKITVNDADGQRTTSVSFEGRVPTTVMRVAGFRTMDVEGDARAASALPTYVDFHILLDNTPSMGVAATTADIATMVSNTPDRCAFACHDLSAGGNDYYALAKKLGVTMRIDVVRQATQRLMDTARTTAAVPGQYRTALHTFGTACTGLGLSTLSALTSDLLGVKASASSIDLMTIPFQNFNNDQCTDFDGTFTALNKVIQKPGDGSKASSPQKVLFFVSDGVADAFYPSTCSQPTTGGRCQEPIKVADCKLLKDRGVKVAVLYTTYLPLPMNSWYNTWIGPFAGSIGSQMEACASPGLYFEVGPNQGIAEAMEALFKKTIFQARLTR